MRLLFAITVCSFCAGLWVALAFVRRTRRGQLSMAKQAHPRVGPTHEFFEAGEYRTPRPLRLDQKILQQRPRRPLSAITFSTPPPAPVTAGLESPKMQAPRAVRPVPTVPSVAYATLNGESVPIARIHSQIEPADSSTMNPGAPSGFTTRRKPPKSTGQSATRRIDLTRNGTELPDPYESLRRGSGTPGLLASSLSDRRRAISQN